jgi:hypothetical protein
MQKLKVVLYSDQIKDNEHWNKIMPISPSLIETWILLATSSDPKLKKSREKALENLKKNFGDIDTAIRYLKTA